ncbi:MAG TPA: hypothetical protein VFG42_05705 [Baekduia sp.]|uniref:hypothetical protein n=1 Tax=Baekduia sp. TaxID=2600305 RepID=UPI002D7A156C|nr:hypothetical protein [Baekduia sp.]HET6506262.1 hypothetical protein [Baekduia sp.]
MPRTTLATRISRFTTISPVETSAYAVGFIGLVTSLIGLGLGWSATAGIACGTAVFSVATLSLVRRSAAAVARRQEETLRRLQEQQEEAEAALTTSRQYRAALTSFFADDVEVEETQEIVVTLTGDGSDHYMMRAVTTPTGTQRCRWRRIRVGSTSNEKAAIQPQLVSGGAVLLELDDDNGFWSGLVLFDPPIEPGHTREWSIDLRWSNMAAPLRRNGHDSVWFYTEVPVKQATVVAKYRQDWIERYGAPPDSFERLSPPKGAQSCSDHLGDRLLTWIVPQPELRQQYNAYLLREAPPSGPARP